MAHADQVTPFLRARVKDDGTIESMDCGEKMFGEGSKLHHQITEYKGRFDYQLNIGGLPLKNGKYWSFGPIYPIYVIFELINQIIY